jgi:putative salt-induced outer membrane protein YdiY
MHSFGRFIALAVLLGAPLASPAAQDIREPPRVEFTGDIGYVNVSGNTSVTSLNAGERFIRRLARWQFTQDFGTVYGRTDGEESSNLWRASVRADYGLAARWALYALTAFDRNKFAGIRSRVAYGTGAVARLLATAGDQLNLEAGFQVTRQQDLAGTSDTFNSLRAATTWKHVFSEKASFFQFIEVLPNLDASDDLRVNTETTLVAPLSAHVGMKFSYVVRFDNLPALNAAGTAPLRKSDRILSSGIQISF